MSGDRLLELLRGLTILLFVAAVLLPLGRTRQPWARRARWGAVLVFAIALLYAIGRSLLWAFGQDL